MINKTQTQLNNQSTLQNFPKSISKLRISIKNNIRWNTMPTHNLFKIQLCKSLHRIIYAYRNRVRKIRQSIYNDQNCLTITRCPQQPKTKSIEMLSHSHSEMDNACINQ